LQFDLGRILGMGRGILTTVSRINRRNATPAEECLWAVVRDRKLDGWKFKRQRVIGKFVADFCCLEAKLIVELDGEIHNSRDAQIADALRTEFLSARGYTVIRFRNEEVLHNLLEVLNAIKTNLPTSINSA
jgi:5-methyltetrahydrofolate--homocysteine methyltransferase